MAEMRWKAEGMVRRIYASGGRSGGKQVQVRGGAYLAVSSLAGRPCSRREPDPDACALQQQSSSSARDGGRLARGGNRWNVMRGSRAETRAWKRLRVCVSRLVCTYGIIALALDSKLAQERQRLKSVRGGKREGMSEAACCLPACEHTAAAAASTAHLALHERGRQFFFPPFADNSEMACCCLGSHHRERKKRMEEEWFVGLAGAGSGVFLSALERGNAGGSSAGLLMAPVGLPAAPLGHARQVALLTRA